MPLFNEILKSQQEPKTTSVESPTDGIQHNIKVYRKCKSGWAGVTEKSRGELVACPCAYTQKFSSKRAANAFMLRFPNEDLKIFVVEPTKTVGKHPFTIRTKS